MRYPAIFVWSTLLLIAITKAGPARLRTTVRTPIIRRGIRKGENGDYFEYITKAQTHNPPAEYRIEKGPNGNYWEVTIRKTIHTHEGRRRMLTSLPRTQSSPAIDKMPQTCDCEPTRSQSTGECWYFTRKGIDHCMKRPCRLKFLCTSRKTGLTCMLRKTTSKVVPTSIGKCVEERVHGFLYAPYSAY